LISGKADDLDQHTPEFIDHHLTAKNINYNVCYIFEYLTGGMWSELPAFAI
jgi:hypothetical protein